MTSSTLAVREKTNNWHTSIATIAAEPASAPSANDARRLACLQHALDERVSLSSIESRAELLAALLGEL